MFSRYFITTSGSVFEVNYKGLKLSNVYKLQHTKSDGQTGWSQLTRISMSESFCAIGCDDGSLQLWPLDFRNFFLEAGIL